MTSLNSRPHRHNLVAIQSLRGIAAWTVVYHHFMQVFFDFENETIIGFFFSVHGGLGVDVFFIISGFVMHYSLSQRSYGALKFALYRIIRIVPAYWMATILLIIAVQLGFIKENYIFALWDFKSLLQSLAFIPHEHLSGLGIFPVLTVGWTLNFEMFFYFLLATSLFFFGNAPLIFAGAVLFIFPLISEKNWIWGPVITNFILYQFIIGMVLSYLYQRKNNLILSPKFCAFGASIFLGAAVLYLIIWGPYLNFVVSTFVVVSALLLEDEIARKAGFLPRFFSKMGDLSYSVYLYHPLVLFLLFSALGAPKSVIGCVGLIVLTTLLTTWCSWISFMLMERRFGGWCKVELNKFGI